MKKQEHWLRVVELIRGGERVQATAKKSARGQVFTHRESFAQWETSCHDYLAILKDKPYLDNFKKDVKSRMLPNVERGLGILRSVKDAFEKGYLDDYVSAKEKVKPDVDNYVDEERIKELQSLEKPKYDTAKLLKLCEELNQNYKWKNYFAVGALLRTILHHVPPIFEMSKFEHVASNYEWGQSDKKSIMRLHQSAKNIADNLLHKHIKERESLPKKTRVNFAPELDVLLGEILIKLKS